MGSKGVQLKRHIDATLGSGNIMEAVKLPPGEDLKEWLAVNTVDFYNAVSVLYATLSEFCTDRTCEIMSAGSKVCVHGRDYCMLAIAGCMHEGVVHASMQHAALPRKVHSYALGFKAT